MWKKASLMKGETTFICGYKGKYLQYSYKLYWFSKVVVVGSPLGFMMSPTMHTWLGL